MTTVLVAYASKRGATVEIAEAIAEKLRERHLGVDCRPARSVENLFGYSAAPGSCEPDPPPLPRSARLGGDPGMGGHDR
jgi:hypothetical protein